MEPKTMMLAGATAAFALGTALAPAAQADPVPRAESYADLLVPVPDAAARIQADDANAASEQPYFQLAQYGGAVAHHHHHHHHHQQRRSARWWRSHGYVWGARGWQRGPVHHHHHHHHSHHHHHHNSY